MRGESASAGAPLEAVSAICELVLETDDLERLKGFYNSLGLETLQRREDRIWLAAGGRSRLGIWSPGRKEHGDRGGRHVHFAISAQRRTIERVASALRAEGTEVEGPIEHPGGDRSLYFSDPDGNRVELWNFFRDGDGADDGVEALAD